MEDFEPRSTDVVQVSDDLLMCETCGYFFIDEDPLPESCPICGYELDYKDLIEEDL